MSWQLQERRGSVIDSALYLDDSLFSNARIESGFKCPSMSVQVLADVEETSGLHTEQSGHFRAGTSVIEDIIVRAQSDPAILVSLSVDGTRVTWEGQIQHVA